MKLRLRPTVAVALAPALAVLLAFWLLPLTHLNLLGAQGSDGNGSGYWQVLSSAQYLGSLAQTCLLALVVTLAALLVGGISGVFLARNQFFGRSALVALLFGLPSLRIKGFYLLVSTLAAQFVVEWVLTRFSWFTNDNASGVITSPPLIIAGVNFSSPQGRYLLTLGLVVLLFWLARNLLRGELGRNWMAVRDMDTAAAVIGIRLFKAKLLAFAISGFYLGVAGSLWAFAYLGTVEPHGFDLNRSFQILFIIIIGGLGSVQGNFLGAAFIVLFPILLGNLSALLPVGLIDSGQLENIQKMLFGALIIAFLIKEPEGLARLWLRLRQRARVWPLRY
nr:branched-chain amino acid ABC transporter permease [Pseudomonas amygdali]